MMNDRKEIPVDNRYTSGEQWHGMERRSSCWCKAQAEAMEKLTKNEREDWLDIDGVGIIDWLYNMAEANFCKALDTSEEMMEYMIRIVISPENADQRYWRYKLELLTDIFEYAVGVNIVDEEGNIPLQKEVEKYWDELYRRAVEKVLERAKSRLYLNDAPFHTEWIPKEPPWTIEDFVRESEYDLIEILFEAVNNPSK